MRFKRYAKARVNFAGMCCATTKAHCGDVPTARNSDSSAGGPPVDAPMHTKRVAGCVGLGACHSDAPLR